MTKREKGSKFSPVLDPVDRSQEVVFGVLMAMSITGSLSVADASRGEVTNMLIAALSCNLAWGFTDAVMYLVSSLTERHRQACLVRRVQEAFDDRQANTIIAAYLPSQLAGAATALTLDMLREGLMRAPIPSTDLSSEDILGAVGVFLLVILATFPIVLPFVLIDEPMIALRVSNLLGLVTLYCSGIVLGRYAGAVGWQSGLAMCAIGAVLVAVIVAFGG